MSDKKDKERTAVMRNPPAPFYSAGPVKPHVPVPWADKLSEDPTEHALLAAIRATPADEGARLVYADWLEQHDRTAKAAYVRHVGLMAIGDPLAYVGELQWRRIVSRAPISECEHSECPGRWDLLTADPLDEMTRSCAGCTFVRYVVTPAEAATAGGEAGCPIAIDPQAPGTVEQRYKIALAQARLRR